MKRNQIVIGAFAGLLVVAASANAQRNLSIGELVQYRKVSPQEAATIVAISRGLNIPSEYVLMQSQGMLGQVWSQAPAFSISERYRIPVREVWNKKLRGMSWDQIENDASRFGRYDSRGSRDRDWNWDDSQRREWDNLPRKNDDNRGGIDDILRRREDDRYRPSNRNEDYERRVWEQLLDRTFGRDASRATWWTERRLHYGDIALAGHVARVAKVNIDDVLYHLTRTHNWNVIRNDFGIDRTWERQTQRPRWDRIQRYDRSRDYDWRRDRW